MQLESVRFYCFSESQEEENGGRERKREVAILGDGERQGEGKRSRGRWTDGKRVSELHHLTLARKHSTEGENRDQEREWGRRGEKTPEWPLGNKSMAI